MLDPNVTTKQLPGELPAAPRPKSTLHGLGRVARTPEFFPALAALGVFVFWATAQGGVGATNSYPGALILLGVLSATGYALRAELLALPRLPLATLLLLAGFALWSFASITWADDQGAAWDGANRCLLYLAVFAIFVIPRWRPRPAALLMGLYVLALTVVGVVVLLKAAGSTDPLGEYFIAGRFAEPTGYHNANAALFTSGMFIAIFLSSRRETPWPVRGVMLAAAGILFQLALMPQSRGWLIAIPIALLAYLILVPGLARSLASLIPLALVAAITGGPVLDVYDTVNRGDPLGPAMDDARAAMIVAAVLLLLVGAAVGLADRRIEIPQRVAAVGNRVVKGSVAFGALAALVTIIALIGNPVSWAGDRWDEFRGGEFEHAPDQGSRLAQGLGSNRYDFWRVAADEFADSPLRGVGAENFAQDYVRDRESEEEPTYVHNLPLSIVSEMGLIGGFLLGGCLVAAFAGIARVRRRAVDPMSRGIAAVIVVVFVYWFVHSVGDWFWAFPALSAPIFAWLAIGMRLGAERPASTRGAWSRTRSAPLAAAAVIAAVIAATSFALPWFAALEVEKASKTWGADPELAYDRLDRAHDINFLSGHADLVQGAIAARLGDPQRIRSSFSRALERDPRNWYANLELAALDAIEGDSRSALERLDRVAELNPMEPLTAVIRRGVASGKPVTLEALDRAFLERYCDRLGRRSGPNGCA